MPWIYDDGPANETGDFSFDLSVANHRTNSWCENLPKLAMNFFYKRQVDGNVLPLAGQPRKSDGRTTGWVFFVCCNLKRRTTLSIAFCHMLFLVFSFNSLFLVIGDCPFLVRLLFSFLAGHGKQDCGFYLTNMTVTQVSVDRPYFDLFIPWIGQLTARMSSHTLLASNRVADLEVRLYLTRHCHWLQSIDNKESYSMLAIDYKSPIFARPKRKWINTFVS